MFQGRDREEAVVCSSGTASPGGERAFESALCHDFQESPHGPVGHPWGGRSRSLLVADRPVCAGPPGPALRRDFGRSRCVGARDANEIRCRTNSARCHTNALHGHTNGVRGDGAGRGIEKERCGLMVGAQGADGGDRFDRPHGADRASNRSYIGTELTQGGAGRRSVFLAPGSPAAPLV